jgi:hypothetical protein
MPVSRDNARAIVRALSPISWLLLLAGIGALGIGVWLFRLYSPSPHMLLEIAIAVPLIGVGGVLVSWGLLRSHRQLPGAVTIVAAVTLTISLVPLGLWIILVGVPWVSSFK